MPKLVKKLTANFTIINNRIFSDINLGATERGVLCTMLSLADGWDFSIRGLAVILPDGVTKISTALKKLEKAHYLIRRRVYKNGKIIDWDYIISDEPMVFDDSNAETTENVENLKKSSFFMPNLDTETLDTENPNQENKNIEKPHDNKINKNKESKNKESNYQVSINQSSENSQNLSTNFQQAIVESDRIDMIDKSQKQEEKRKIVGFIVRQNIEYDWYEDFFADNPDNSMHRGQYTYASNMSEIDMLVDIIVDTLCSDNEYIRIGKQDMFHAVVESRFKKLKMKHIEYALKCLMLNTKDIKNPIAYIMTVLYNASMTCDFAESNELKNLDPAMFIPEQFHDEAFREKHYEHTAFYPKNSEW